MRRRKMGFWEKLRFDFVRLTKFGVDYRRTLYDKLMRFAENRVAAVDTIRCLLDRMVRTKDSRQHVLREWLHGLEDGHQLHEVMEGAVPKMDLIMIAAGARNGNLALGLRQAIYLSDAVRRMKGALVQALTMPIVLAIMGCVILVFVVTEMAPQMRTAFGKIELPALTQSLIEFGEFIINWGWLVAIAVVGSITASVMSLSRWSGLKGSLRNWLDNFVPPWALYREFQASGTLIALHALLGGNVQIRVATEMIAANADRWLARHLRSAVRSMLQGKNEAIAFDTGLFPKDVQEDIDDYSRNASFGEVLAAIASTLVERTEKAVKRYGAVLQGMVFLLVGAFAVWMYLGMLLAGAEMYQSMRDRMSF
jgi:type II secretory pathway component PulF